MPRSSDIALAAAAALALIGGPARASEPQPPVPSPPLAAPAAPAGTIATARDAAERMTVPVMVDGRGPFPFVVDTGADRTVISRELAAQLSLPADAPVMLNGTAGAEVTNTARIETLDVGGRRLSDIAAPLLSAANLGAMGMIGIDSLRGQRIDIDFKHQTMSVSASRPEPIEPGVVVVHARRRYGELVLVDASIADEPIFVILDSGAQNSIGNAALLGLVGRHGLSALRSGGDVISVTGRTTPATFALLPQVQIGGFDLQNQPIAFANLHTFAEFALQRQPAMLLGMDTLRVFERVTVDFGRKEVRFKMAVAAVEPKVQVADAR